MTASAPDFFCSTWLWRNLSRVAWARYFTWLSGKRTPEAVIASKEVEEHEETTFLCCGRLSFWGEKGKGRELLLNNAIELLNKEGWRYELDNGWSDWDIEIFGSRWWHVRIRTLSEHYPEEKRLTSVANILQPNASSILVVILGVSAMTVLGLGLGLPWWLTFSTIVSGLSYWVARGLMLRHRIADLIEAAAHAAGMTQMDAAKVGNETVPPGRLLLQTLLGSILVALVLMLLTIGLNLLKPWPFQYIIDNILPQAAGLPPQVTYDFIPSGLPWLDSLLYTVGAFILLYLLSGLFNLINSYWLVEIGLKALLRLRTEVYSYLQSLPLRFHDSRRSGDSSFRVAYDTQAIQTFFNRGFATIISSSITLVGAFILMWQVNVFLTLLSLLVIPFLLGAIFFFAERVRRESAVVQQEESDVLSKVSEGLSSIRVVHAFGREEFEVQAFSKEAADSLEANRKLTLTNVSSSLVIGFITAVGSALLMYYGVLEVQQGHLKLGQLTVFIAYLAMLYQPLEQLSYTVWAMEGAASGVSRVFEILDTKNDVQDEPHAKIFQAGAGKIELKDVHFSYSADQPVLRGLSLEIPAGKTIALVGGTGAGKTTILSLIPRFYDPTAGQVLVDDQNVRQVKKRSLRNHISMVLQDTALIPGSIEENIAYGNPQAGKAEIIAAAEAAQAADFIRDLPQGYATQVGERGVRLSGGQRQRIGIARAFLRNSPILLLDEPTSALDLKTEAELMGTLKNLRQKPTTLIITHRLSTVHHADCIHVLKHGQIIESGTGPELLAKGGLYAELWNAPNQ